MDPAVYAYYERLSRNPDDAESLYFLWEHHGGRGEFQQLAQLVEQTAARRASPSSAADLYYRAGELWSKNVGRADKAVACYKRSFELDPSQVQSAESARQIYTQLGNYRAASQLLTDQLARTADPLLRGLLLREGVQLYGQLQDWDAQIAYLEEVLSGAPDDWEMLRELAGAYLSRAQSPKGQPDDNARAAQVLSALAQNVGGDHGLAFAEAALDAWAGDEAAYAIVHETYLRADRVQDLALRQIAFLGANPTSAYAPTIRRGLAEMYASVGQYDDAIACLEPLAPDDLEVARTLAGLYRAAGRADELAVLLQQFAPTADPAERVRDLKDLAELYGNQGNRAGMLASMGEVLTIDPADPEALALVEDDLRARGEHATLREVLAEAVRAEHCPPEMRVARLREIASLSLEHLDDAESAMHAYRELLDATPDDPEALEGLDVIFSRAGEWEEVAAILDRRIAAAPDDATLRALLLRRADLSRDHLSDRAAELDAVTRAWTLSPDADDLSERLIALRRASGDLAGVAEVLAARAERSPADRAIDRWRELAVAREQAGQPEEAVRAWREVLRLDPEHDDAFDALERALDAAGDQQARFDLLRQRASALPRGPARAALHARASAAARALGDSATALDEAEAAVAMDPQNESLALSIIDALDALGQHQRLLAFINERLGHVHDGERRASLLRRAAQVLAESDPLASSQYWEELRALSKRLGDGDDAEAIGALLGFAEADGDYGRVARLLEDAAAAAPDGEARRALLTRRARTLIDPLGQLAEGVAALEAVAREVAPDHVGTWALLEEVAISAGRRALALDAMRRQLALLGEEDDEARSALSTRAVALADGADDDPGFSYECLRAAHEADPGDLGLTQRIAETAEAMERWEDAVAFLGELAEVEGDDEEVARLSLRIAAIADERLDDPRRAWDVLLPLAMAGDLGCVEMLQDLSTRRGLDAELVPKLEELAEKVQDGEARAALFTDAATRRARVLLDLPGALTSAVKAVESAPTDAAALRAMSELCRSAGTPAKAVPGWRAALEHAPDATTAHDLAMLGVDALLAAGGKAEALDFALFALSRAPADDELLDAAVRLAPGSGRDQDVYIALDRRKKTAQSDAERLAVTLRAMEVAALAVDDADTGLQYLDQAVALSFSKREPDEARLAEVEAAVRAVDAASPERGFVTALVERLAHRADDAADDDPRSAAVLLRRAGELCASDLALDDDAWTLFGRAVTAWPGDARAADALEACGARLGRLADVATRYERVIDDAYDASVARAYTQRRATLLAEHLDRLGDAIAALQRVVEIAPRDIDAIHRWQSLLERAGRWQDLLLALEREVEAGGDRGACLRKMARIWETQLRNAHEARQLWRRVLRVTPDDAEATEALQRLERRPTAVADDFADEPAAPEAPAPPPREAPEVERSTIESEPPVAIAEPAPADPRSAYFEPAEEPEAPAAPAADPRLAFFEPEEPVQAATPDEEVAVEPEADAIDEVIEADEDEVVEAEFDAIDEVEDALDAEVAEVDEIDEGPEDAEGPASLDDLAMMVAPPVRRDAPAAPPLPARAPPPLPPMRRRED